MPPAHPASRKPRGDAKLKTLPFDQQEALWEFLRDHTLAEAVDHARKELQVRTSIGAMSIFHTWYGVQRKLRQRAAKVEAMLEAKKRLFPDMSDGELFAEGQRYFSEAALAEDDPETWRRIKLVDLNRADQALAREKFERETCELFLKWSRDKRAADLAARTDATHEEKIEALKQMFFEEDEDA